MIHPYTAMDDTHTTTAVRRASCWLQKRYGLVLETRRAALSKVLTYLARREQSDVETIVGLLMSGQSEFAQPVLEAISIPETHLFRHSGHFHFLSEFAQQCQLSGASCRVLCVGCATGEEVWSAAAVLAALAPWSVQPQVVGWELVAARLEEARRGYIRPWAARTGFLRYERFFLAAEGGWLVEPQLRELVSFEQVNILTPGPPTQRYDVIMFRNVSIYWTIEVANLIFERLSQWLTHEGAFLIGPSDPVNPDPKRWTQNFVEGGRLVQRRPSNESHRRSKVSFDRPRPLDTNPVARQLAPQEARAASIERSKEATVLPCAKGSSSIGNARRAHKSRPSPLKRRSEALAPEKTSARARSRKKRGVLETVHLPAEENPPSCAGEASLAEVRALADAGAYEEALEHLHNLPMNAARAEVKYWEGILNMNLERPHDAVSCLRQCVFLDAQDPSYRRWLALAYDDIGRTAEAERERRNAIELEVR